MIVQTPNWRVVKRGVKLKCDFCLSKSGCFRSLIICRSKYMRYILVYIEINKTTNSESQNIQNQADGEKKISSILIYWFTKPCIQVSFRYIVFGKRKNKIVAVCLV